jgi:predicted N-acyltransferase
MRGGKSFYISNAYYVAQFCNKNALQDKRRREMREERKQVEG